MKGRILNIVLVLVLAMLPMAANAGWSEAQEGTLGVAEAQQATSVSLTVQRELGTNPQDSAANSGYFVADLPQLNPGTSSPVSRNEDFANQDAMPGVEIEALLASAIQVTTGWHHSCALTYNGALKCWGSNGEGRLGDGTTINRNTPVDVAGLNSGVEGVAGGGSYTCALTHSGGVKCWGANSFGQLGDGTTINRHTPVDVVGLSTGVTALAVGFEHTCVLTSGGGVKCWGRNASGQLGDGTFNDRLTPVDVVGLTSGVTAVAARGSHTCALTLGGGVKCWGRNASGQLGDGTTFTRRTAVDVVGLTSGVIAIAGGSDHTCALTQGGGAKCWGSNANGQLGDGTTTTRLTPTNVVSMANRVIAIGAGAYHTCGVTAIGAALCWGGNFHGELGDGTNVSHSTPTQVFGLNVGMAVVRPGAHHTCGLTANGGVKCWGDNHNGEIGDGTGIRRLTPVDVVGFEAGDAGPPVILVHGWMGAPWNLLNPETWRRCDDGLQMYNPGMPHHAGWSAIENALRIRGYSVYVANLTTSPIRTPSFESNAQCLKRQIEQVASPSNRAVLIAHSMGGLVSRAYLENEELYLDNVEHLITLGTPHGGVTFSAILRGNVHFNAAICMAQPAVCQFSRDGVAWVNYRYSTRVFDTGYTLIGGEWRNAMSLGIAVTEGPNDTAVGRRSAQGMYWPFGTAVDNNNGLVERYGTITDHGGYFNDSPTVLCILSRLGLDGECPPPAEMTESYTVSDPLLTGRTVDLTGSLNVGQTLNSIVPIDTTGASVFMLTWLNGDLSLTLTDPSGQVITPAYAAANPAHVSYSSGSATPDTPPWVSYAFTNTVPGLWTLSLAAASVPPEGTNYMATAYMETDTRLVAATDQSLYQIGDTATFTAALSSGSGGIAGAAVEAVIARSDGVTETIQLADHEDGTYQGTYVVPDAPGLMLASVAATGTNDGLSFSRQVDLAMSVASPYVSLTEQYSAYTPDDNGDGKYDALLIDAGISATRPTTVTLSGSLVSAEITRTITAITTAMIDAGTHVVTLNFPGRSIHRLRSNGPYTLTNVVLEDIGVGGVQADAANDAFVTAAYDFRQFGLRGDVDDSCEVDIQDVISIASAWNTSDFDPVLDINRDGVITIVDVMLAAGNWGASCWE